MPKTSSAILSWCPPENNSVKSTVTPVKPQKRVFPTNAATGLSAGTTLAYASPSERNVAIIIAVTLARRLAKRFGKSPWSRTRGAKARTTSRGVGRTSNDVVVHAAKRQRSHASPSHRRTAGETTRLGLTASARFMFHHLDGGRSARAVCRFARSGRASLLDQENDLDAPVGSPPLLAVIRAHGLFGTVSEDLEPMLREVLARVRLQPILHGESAPFGQHL